MRAYLIALVLFTLSSLLPLTAQAITYGEGNYGEGVFGGNTATPTPSPTATAAPSSNNTTSSNSGSSGSSTSTNVCSNAKPSGIPDLFQINSSTNTLSIYFSPVSSNRDRYFVSYGTTSNVPEHGFEFENNENGVVMVDVNALKANTTYYFRVRAGNGCQPGDFSNELAATTGRRSPTYRWAALGKILNTAVARVVNPASVKKVAVDTSTLPPPVQPPVAQPPVTQPSNNAVENTVVTQPSVTNPVAADRPAATLRPAQNTQVTQPTPGQSASQSSTGFFARFVNFIKGVFGG